MARITNEELKKMIDELADKLPNGELHSLQIKIEELQAELKKFTKSLYNPDDGLKVRVNQNQKNLRTIFLIHYF